MQHQRQQARNPWYPPTRLLLALTIQLVGCEVYVGEDPETEGPDLTEVDALSGDPSGSSPSDSMDTQAEPENAPAAGGPAMLPPIVGNSRANGPQTNPGGPSSPAPPSDSDDDDPAADDPASECDTAPIEAQAVLTEHCSSCHGTPVNAGGGFSTILDVPAMLASSHVVEQEPAMSLIFIRMSNGSMPPSGIQSRPSDDDIEAIETWIECGAENWYDDRQNGAVAFASTDWRLETVLDDLRSTTNPADRERYRYIDLSPLANAGYSEASLQVYREAVSFLLNSVSLGRTVVGPTAVDDRDLIYRLDLRDYLWEAETWTQLEADYPYAVIYDQDSRLFPFDEDSAEQIREETATEIPIIQADWFISHASRPPLYFSLLELPETLGELEDQLGIDIDFNIETEQVLRSGFANSEPSNNNRVIERHDLGGSRGAFWQSFDFASSVDEGNIFANPLDFVADGGEMIFNLENGLQGYYIADAAGNRLDKAPTAVVQDPAARDGAVETGISCMNCHMTQGQLPKYDEVRDFQLQAGANAEEIEQVLALYAPRDELEEAFEADQARYQSALAELEIENLSDTTMHELDNIHLGVLDIGTVAAVVGITVDELKRAIDASPQSFPAAIVTLRTQGGGIQRDAFEDIVGDLVLALGLGEQLLVDDFGVRVEIDEDNL